MPEGLMRVLAALMRERIRFGLEWAPDRGWDIYAGDEATQARVNEIMAEHGIGARKEARA